MNAPVKLSVVLPCYNEEETLEACIREAQEGIEASGVTGEVIVADNNSTDRSREIALQAGARVVEIEPRGYGNALSGGINAARGEYVIMGDADMSYDFTHVPRFVEKLDEGYDLVMGNRFAGGIQEGAMPWKNRVIGNPILSGIGKLLFKISCGDFHCGLRGFRRDAFDSMHLNCSGMEFASEMVIKSELLGLKISEVPTVLRPDGRSGSPRLRPWRDGLRHLILMLSYSPQQTFFWPGVTITVLSAVLVARLAVGPIRIFGASFDIGTMLISAMLLVLGMQLVLLSHIIRVYVNRNDIVIGVLRRGRLWKAGRLVTGGLVIAFAGITVIGYGLFSWWQQGFSDMDPFWVMRVFIPGVTLGIVGALWVFNGLFQNILEIPLRRD
jgi:glycosyltransferase involved in cell wall biosynthesis